MLKYLFTCLIFFSFILSFLVKAQDLPTRVENKNDLLIFDIQEKEKVIPLFKSNCDAVFEMTIYAFINLNEVNFSLTFHPIQQISNGNLYRWDLNGTNQAFFNSVLAFNFVNPNIPTLQNTTEICLTVRNQELACEQTYCMEFNYQALMQLISTSSAIGSECDGLNCDLSFTPAFDNFEYQWIFPDNTVINGNPINHAFSNSGLHHIQVTVKDPVEGYEIHYRKLFYAFEQNYAGLEIHLLINDLNQNIQNILFGDCIEVENVNFSGSTHAIAYFYDENARIGFHEGLLITTGDPFLARGPNLVPNAGKANGRPGYELLNQLISNLDTYDAAVISFDFTSSMDSIVACNYVFASEEYPEFVGSQFNDVFGFFIKEEQESNNEFVNLAKLPGTDQSVSINNVNESVNSEFYIQPTSHSDLVSSFQYDGFTTPLEIIREISSSSNFNFVIAIADATDDVYDSAVFIEAGSFVGNEPKPIARFDFTANELAVKFFSLSENSQQYYWNFGDGNTSDEMNPEHIYEQAGTYQITLECKGNCRKNKIWKTIKVKNAEEPQIMMDDLLNIYLSSSSQLNIEFNTIHPVDLKLELFDISGKIIHVERIVNNQQTVDIQKLNQGIYIAKLTERNGANVTVKKIIKH